MALAAVLSLAATNLVSVDGTVEALATRAAGAPVEVLVPESDVSRVEIGAPVTIRALIASTPVKGRINARGSRVERFAGRAVVRFTTDIEEKSLLEGMSGTASISAGSERLFDRLTRWCRRALFG